MSEKRITDSRRAFWAILAGAVLVAAACGVAMAEGGKRHFWQQVYDGQVFTSTAASNSVTVMVADRSPIGNYAVELRTYGTGTVDYVYAQVSQDGKMWYNAALVITNTAVSIDSTNAPSGVYTAVTLPASPWVRLSGVAVTNEPIVDAWIIVH